ncbi:MAG TPA: BtpA/SgcQ family protein [Anaerolineae bacterium]|nr:BtpA/SgcQ family protein [Anaerolineae bacterium]
MNTLNEIFFNPKPVIGMVHLHPLPGSPLFNPQKMDMDEVVRIAVEEAKILEEAGVDGLQIENIWDFPYQKGCNVGHETTAAMAVAATKVKGAVSIPIGINCHLNAGTQALAIAAGVGAKWIRVFEWVNAYISHAGILEGIAADLSRYRGFLHANKIIFFCDVNVKHGSHFIISDRTIAEQARDAENEGAEVLIVTGDETGKAPTIKKVKELSDAVKIPILIGSGTTTENVVELLGIADGAIVGSNFKQNNDWKKSLDEKAIREFMKMVEELRKGIE